MKITDDVSIPFSNKFVPAIIKAIENLRCPFAILEIDRDDKSEIIDFCFTYINKAGASLITLRQDQILGKRTSELFPDLFSSEFIHSLFKSTSFDKPLSLKSIFINEIIGQERIKGYFDLDITPDGDRIFLSWEDVTERESYNEKKSTIDDIENKLISNEINENPESVLSKKTVELQHTNRRLLKEIKDRKNAETAMRAERQQLVNVLETLPLYLILLTPDYHVSFANKFFRERFGADNGLRCFEFLFGRNEPCEICETYKVMNTGLPHHWEWTGPDGHDYDIFDFPFTDTDGTKLIMEMGLDITERKKAEKELENYHLHLEELIRERTMQYESANRQLQIEIAERRNTEEELEQILIEVERRAAELDAVLDSMPDGISITGVDGRILRMNKAAEKILGYSISELDNSIPERLQKLQITKPDGTLFPKEESPTYKALNGETIIGTIQVMNHNDNAQWLSVNSAPICVQGGKKLGAVTSFTDITESKRIEENLIKERENLQTLFDVVNVGMLLIDKNGNVKRVNNTLSLWLGKELMMQGDDIQPGDIVRCIHALNNNTGCGKPSICKECNIRNTFDSVLKTGLPVHNMEAELSVLIMGNPVHLWLEINADPVTLDGEQFVILCMNNITSRKLAETTLKENEQRLNGILSSIQDGFFELNHEGQFTFINQRTQIYIGVKSEALLGESIWEVFPNLRGSKYEEIYYKVMKMRVPYNFETNRFIKDQWYEIDIYPSESGICVFWRDINLRKKAEKEMHNLNRTLIAYSKSSQVMMRADDEYSYLNEVCKIITEDCGHAMVWIGYAEDDENKTVRPVAYSGFEQGYLDTLKITWSDNERGCGPTGTAIKKGEPSFCRDMNTDPKFKPWREEALKHGYASSAVFPLKDSNKVFGAITIYSSKPDAFSKNEIELLTDLANDLAYGIMALRLRKIHKIAEEELRRSEEQYHTLFNGMTEGFAIHEIILNENGNPVDYRFLDINPAFERITGLKREITIGKTHNEVLPNEDPYWIQIYGNVAITGKPVHFENYSHGLKKYFEVYSYQNAPYQFATIFMDVTNRKQAELALKINRSRAELLAKTASSLLASNDPQNIVEELCLEVMQFLGCHVFFNYLVDESSGKLHLNAYNGISEEESEKIRWLDYGEAVCGCVAQQRCRIIAEDIFMTSDSRTKELKIWGIQAYVCHPLMSQNKLIGTLAFGTQSRSRFSGEDIELMNTVSDLVAIALNRVAIEHALQESEERFKQLADTMPQLVWTAKPDGSIDYYNKRADEFDGISQNEDGTWTWAPVVLNEDLILTKKAWDTAIKTGDIYEMTHRIKMKNGIYKWFLSRGYPIKNPEGGIIKWFGTATDIHGQKLSEEILRQTLTDLENSNRDLEQFAYIASHDLQEPIRMIKNYSQILERKYKNKIDATANEFLGYISDGATRMHQLVSDLLKYSRVSTKVFPFEEVDSNLIIKEVVEDLRGMIQETNAVISTDIMPTIRGDYTQLRQLFQNLIQNAVKFRSEKRPEIQIRCRKINGSWLFTISDNGIGIDSMYFSKIFVIFQRLHEREKYPGTGIGLALCKKIIERHNGEIHVESEVGKGTTFHFTLPAAN